jgi:hypothetical protein
MTSTTRMTSIRVTRERGIPLMVACPLALRAGGNPACYGSAPGSRERSSVLVLCLMPRPAPQPDPVAQCAVEEDGDSVCERKDDRHHHGGLRDKRQAGKPQFDAVPPVEEAVHPARVFDARMTTCQPK